MPKSRKRKPRRSSKTRPVRRTRAANGWGEFEPWARAMVMADEAEARGDAIGALDVMNAFMIGPDGKEFWRVWRMKYLLQIANLGEILPPWATSRWICNQALQCLHEGNRDRIRRAFDAAVELRGKIDPPAVGDAADVHAWVADRSWVYRQLFLFELGGLEFFVRRIASSTLLADADSIDMWPGTPMGAYELVESGPAVVTWLDLASNTLHMDANIGSAVFVGPGEHAIGRLVPIEGGVMFECQPLSVPKQVAYAVAERPADWLQAMQAAEEPILTLTRPQDSVVSDVPALVWQLALVGDDLPPGDPGGEGFSAALSRAVLDAGARELRHEAEDRPDGEVDIWACLGAALLEPYVVAALPEVWRPADRRLFERLGEVLARPASDLCLAAAQELSEAA